MGAYAVQRQTETEVGPQYIDRAALLEAAFLEAEAPLDAEALLEAEAGQEAQYAALRSSLQVS